MELKNILDIKKTKIYNKMYLLYKDSYYNLRTGKEVDKIVTARNIVITVNETNTANFLTKKSKISSIPYCYKMKKTKDYIMSQNLTSNYMKAMLFDYYDTNSIVITSPSFLIIFLGHKTQKIIKIKELSTEEISSSLGNIFQGIHFKHIELIDLIKIVKRKQKVLPYLVLTTLIIFITAWYIYSQAQQHRNEIIFRKQLMKMQKTKVVSKPLTSDFISVVKTNFFLKQLYSLPLSSGSFIGNVNFQQKQATIFSFAPMKDSSLNNYFFKKTIIIPIELKNEKKIFKIKSAQECMSILGKYNDIIRLKSIQKKMIKFVLENNNFSVKNLNIFLKKIYKCPIEITGGFIQFKNLNKRNVGITMYLVNLK